MGKGLPEREDVLIKNATVWTATDQGMLENTDVLVRDGNFAAIGETSARQVVFVKSMAPVCI